MVRQSLGIGALETMGPQTPGNASTSRKRGSSRSLGHRDLAGAGINGGLGKIARNTDGKNNFLFT